MSTTVPGRADVPAQHVSAGQVPAQADPATSVTDRAGPQGPSGSTRSRCGTVRDAIHVGACLLAGVLITVGFLLDPTREADGGTEIVAAVAAAPDRFYAAMTLAAFGFAMTAAAGLAVLRLVRGRGRVLATIGGLLLTIGGVAAAAGLFMFGAVLTALVESGQDLAVVASLQDSLEGSPRTGLTFIIGFPATLLGLVVCAVALLVSRAVPRWTPVALLAGVVAVLALSETAVSSIADLLLTVGLAGVGLALWRATSGTRTG